MRPDETLTEPMGTGPLDESELDAAFATNWLAFGHQPQPVRASLRQQVELDRAVASRDGGDVVGVAHACRVEMTLPGPVVEPVNAVVGIAVRPTHRREGRLRSMMRYQLDDFHERGEPLATLTASESRIYQRFGYGPATLASWYEIEKDSLELVRGSAAGSPAGERVRFVDRSVARASFPKLLARYQATRAGEVSRLAPEWDEILGEDGVGAAALEGGAAGRTDEDRFFVEVTEEGEASGYAVYRIESEPGPPRRRLVRLLELCAPGKDAYLGLWSFLVGIDLVPVLRTGNRPVDEPVRWALSDYRRMRPVRTSEHTYVRLVDVGAALGLRRLYAPGELVLQVDDPFCPWNKGLYRLSAGGEAALGAAGEHEGLTRVKGSGALVWTSVAERLASRRAPGGAGGVRQGDLRLDVSALGSVYLGGIAPSALAKVGLIEELTPGSLHLADRMLLGPEPPFCTTNF